MTTKSRRPTQQDIITKQQRIERGLDTLAVQHRLLKEDVENLSKDVRRLVLLLIGDDELEVAGVVERLKETEQELETIKDEREAQANRLRGVAIGLGITGVSGVGTFITVLTQIMN